MKLYLCGPMTGIKQYNFPKFMEETLALRQAGYDVVSPAEHAIDAGFNPIANPDIVCTSEMRRKFLDNDKNMLDECDGMALMSGWASSHGSDEEVAHFLKTRSVDQTVRDVNAWIRRATQEQYTLRAVKQGGKMIPIPDTIADIRSVTLPPTIRTFSTGATRDTDTNKLDFDGFLCPLVLERYAEYMNANRKMADGSLRGSDNWKAGVPQDVYRKSGWRHFFAFWKHCLSGNKAIAIVDACGILFNVMGWMHEELKNDNNRTA